MKKKTQHPLPQDQSASERPKRKTLSGGDMDATADVEHSGEEGVGGSMLTPDQDDIDEMGESVGLTYEDTEPLDVGKKRERDAQRWELDPASSEDYEERTNRLHSDENDY
ncbi:MAG: hypothetical protein NPIRA01_01960 [Nitrospirales bacterium]|nr:MAG: hypothetical protein NPIRA01_01960 [Nitrospirales bacterium]